MRRPPTRGVQVYAIVKSGGNDFHGSGFFAGTEGQFAEPTTSMMSCGPRASRSAAPSTSQYDISGDLGGRIIRNKLWFYGAAAAAPSAN